MKVVPGGGWPIGAQARMIRRRRGLSLNVVAGLAEITKSYLSMLELGQRGFNPEAIRHLDTADRLAPTRIETTPLPATWCASLSADGLMDA
ncbi:MAG: helix-turn-helix domain-containing protein [Pseudonocardiaceae bacterium]